MELQNSDGDVSRSSKRISDKVVNSHEEDGDDDLKKLLQNCRNPQLYCYPRSRAHSSLIGCFRVMEGLDVPLPRRLQRVTSAVLPIVASSLRRVTSNVEKKTNSVRDEKEPLNKRLVQTLYPSSQMPLISDGTVSMVEALLRHLRLPEGTPVFLPGLLLYPYFHLLELFDVWKLRVVGYDIDFVTMRVDEDDFRKKARKFVHRGDRHKNLRGKHVHSGNEYHAIVLLIGISARFLQKYETIVKIACNEFRALTVELHPVTAALFRPRVGGSELADVHITCMDAAGEVGGAVAFSNNPLLASGIFSSLEKRPPAAVKKRWVALARHVFHVLVSDGISFQLALRVMGWWSWLAQKRDGDTQADRIFGFLMASQVENARGRAKGSSTSSSSSSSINGNSSKHGSSEEGIMTRGDNAAAAAATKMSYSQPHRGVLAWMLHAISSTHVCSEVECLSLWEFLSSLRCDVEVVSAGEPTTPRDCVGSHADCLLLRVASPVLAARALRTAGFDAVPALTYMHGSSDSRIGKEWKTGMSCTLREVVVLPECTRCNELAQHVLFLPLCPKMKWKNREKLHRVMQVTFPASLFTSPSAEFQRHVMSTPHHHAYRFPEVEEMIRSWRRHHKNMKASFVDSQPLLLWTLLGPVPGYILSKL